MPEESAAWSRWQRWARDDTRRLLLASVAGAAPNGLLLTLWNRVDPISAAEGVVLACIFGWTLLSLVNVGLLLGTYRRAAGAAFADAIGLVPGETGGWNLPKRLLGRMDVTVASLALAVVAMLAFVPGVSSRPAIVAAGLVMVSVTWVNVAVSTALL
ncbi:MAG: hypothetical protein Q4G40_12285, partial [Brachybacterium sp.]|nr:hypothetical protein [Brachybacterium sp.]